MSGSTIEALRRGQQDGPPSRAFAGRTADEFTTWRRESLARLAEIYRLRGGPAAVPARVVGSAARTDYREERLLLTAPDGVEMPAYALVPPGPGPFRAVVFLHGHEASAEQVLGKADPDPGGHEAYRAYLHSLRWVDEAPRAGYLCLVPEQRGLGELAEPGGSGCEHLALNALAFGATLQGMRVADLIRWVEYLVGRGDVQPGRLVVGGVSLGGELALLLAAFDERVDAAIAAGHVRLLREELHGSAFCPCGYASGLFAEFDVPEIAGLIAPRPLLVQSGDRDPLYPRASAEAGVARLGEIYAAAGGPVDVSFFPGLHEFDGPGALRWLERLWSAHRQ